MPQVLKDLVHIIYLLVDVSGVRRRVKTVKDNTSDFRVLYFRYKSVFYWKAKMSRTFFTSLIQEVKRVSLFIPQVVNMSAFGNNPCILGLCTVGMILPTIKISWTKLYKKMLKSKGESTPTCSTHIFILRYSDIWPLNSISWYHLSAWSDRLLQMHYIDL